MNRLLIFILLLLVSSQLFAQQISVSSFERRDHDLDARVNHPVKDQNGDVCALLKIETTQTGFVFEGGQLGIVKTERKTGEYWVYIPWGSKRISIKHDQLGILRDYIFPESIEKATVYIMQLTTGKVTTIVEEPEVLTQWVVITSEPSGADVYIDGKPTGEKTPFSREYNIGKHEYRLEMPMYYNAAGIFNLKQGGDKEIINLVLQPNFGMVLVNSYPESDAEILIDGRSTGKKTPFEFKKVSSGTHTFTVKKAMFYDAWQEVVVEDNKQISINLNMNPAYGELNITTNPGADIYIDGNKVGNGSFSVRKTSGFYTVEARKEKHTTDTKKVEVVDGQVINLELNPKPQYGVLKISSNPPLADIYIDGVKKGSTPATIRELLIGDYNIELKLKNYIIHSETISISHNQTTEINASLEKGKQITINSSPSGVDLEINGKPVGKTPYTNTVAFGEYKIKLKNESKTLTEKIDVTETGESKWSFTMPKTQNTQSTQPSISKDEEKSVTIFFGSGYGLAIIPQEIIGVMGGYAVAGANFGRSRVSLSFAALSNNQDYTTTTKVILYPTTLNYEFSVIKTSIFNINLGADIGVHSFDVKSSNIDYNKFYFGLNPSLGLELKMFDSFNISANYKPCFLFGDNMSSNGYILGHYVNLMVLINLFKY